VKLPDNSIGINDLIDWIECPRRMSYKMKRWLESGEPPEAAVNPTKMFGAAIHDAIEHIEESGCSNDEAIQFLLANGHRWIDEEVVREMREHLDIYRTRSPGPEWETVMNEGEIRVPFFRYAGEWIYLRGRIDRLYRHRTQPGRFRLRDFKSSRWERSQADVDKDWQMSSYDLMLREFMPEIDDLEIIYDQLRYGERPTSRTRKQRREFRELLEWKIVALLEDDETGPDGLGVPSFNQWCPWCPIMESCAVIPHLTSYAQAEIARLAPGDGASSLDPANFDLYVAELAKVNTAQKVLERFEKTVKARLLQMPASERESYGWKLSQRTFDVFSAEALRAAHSVLGDEEFYAIVSMSKTALTSSVGEDKDRLNLILGMADKVPRPYLRKAGSGRSS
jgi:hypothetical protein